MEDVFKLSEKVLDGCLRKVVDTDKMQYGFMPGIGTVDAVFVHFLPRSFSVGVHQESALSPLLTEDARDGSLIELLYAEDLVLCGESLNEVMDKYGRRKNTVEGKGQRVNVDKTKGMKLLFGKKSSVSKVGPWCVW